MRFVFHVDDEPAAVMIDGKLLIIPPNEPFEVPELRGTDCNNNGPYEYIIPDHQVMAKILDHGWYHGIVEIPMVKTKTGINADIAGASKNAEMALVSAEDRMLTRYVTDQQERVTRENKPAVAPNGRLVKIIEKRGIDLKKEFNIDPPGYTVSKMTDRDAELNALKRELDELKSLIKAKGKA